MSTSTDREVEIQVRREQRENVKGAGFCPRCLVGYEWHPLDEDGVDIAYCPSARTALDLVWAALPDSRECADLACLWAAIKHYRHEPDGPVYALMDQPSPDTGLDPERLARASHARCIAQWEADRQTDPDRMLTMHDWDAHVPATRKDAAEYARLTSSPTAEEDPSDPEHAWRGTADDWRHDR